MPNHIRERRQAAGMTLQDVADKLGTTAVTVSRWEREPQRVTLPILDKLADAIGCSREELLGGEAKAANVLNLGDGMMSLIATFYGLPPENVGIVRVLTDAMAPAFLKGDSCTIDKSITWIDNAGVYAISMNDEARIYRCQRIFNGNVRVTWDNPVYKLDTECTDDEIHVIGKVIGFTRKI